MVEVKCVESLADIIDDFILMNTVILTRILKSLNGKKIEIES